MLHAQEGSLPAQSVLHCNSMLRGHQQASRQELPAKEQPTSAQLCS